MPMDVRYISWAGYDLAECDTTVSGIGGYGTIQLELGWQLIAIPVDFGYWDSTAHEHVHDGTTVSHVENYVIDQIEDLYATVSGVETIIEVANTYLGDNQFFWSYVVGSTPTASPHNFNMVYDDGIHREIAGFWIKVIGLNAPYVITWGEE